MATYQNAFLIYNPFAGKLNRNRDQLLQRTTEVLRSSGHRVTAMPTTGPRTAGAIAAECLRNGADAILAAGGDGTINEVVNGMVGSHVPLGILPGGTANVLAVELGIGTRLVRAAETLGECRGERIALGSIAGGGEKRHFILMAGAGLDAMIVYQIDAKFKAAFGKLAYWLGGFSQIARRLPTFSVRVDGNRSQCSFALASRVRNYGGDLLIARNVTLFDDHFELVLFEGENSLVYVRYLIGIMTNRLARTKGISIVRTQSIDLECASNPGIYVQVDGEYFGRLPVRIEIVPQALTLLVPPSFAERHKGLTAANALLG